MSIPATRQPHMVPCLVRLSSAAARSSEWSIQATDQIPAPFIRPVKNVEKRAKETVLRDLPGGGETSVNAELSPV